MLNIIKRWNAKNVIPRSLVSLKFADNLSQFQKKSRYTFSSLYIKKNNLLNY